MSEINVMSPETIRLTVEALLHAEQQLSKIEADLQDDTAPTGNTVHDRVNGELREQDREIQHQLEGTGYLYFGHTRKIYSYMYDSLLTGYSPTEAQLAQEEGGNFISDEISELYNEHPDIYQRLDEFGYGSDKTPLSPAFSGAYVVPESVVKDILGTLYLRGKEYREWGWGFPWWVR
jgi:hypothetical protein